MRLLPTTGVDEDVDYEDLHEGASTYQLESEYPDDDGQSRYASFKHLASDDQKLTWSICPTGDSPVATTSTMV